MFPIHDILSEDQNQKPMMLGGILMLYKPGQEPEELKKYLNLLLRELHNTYPDDLVVMDMWNHDRWDKVAGYLVKNLGYPNGKAFLNAYGFEVADHLDAEPDYDPEPIKRNPPRSNNTSYSSASDDYSTRRRNSKIEYDPTTEYKPQKGMVFCKECGARISKKAKVCPHCGAKRKKSILGRLLLSIVAIFLILIVLVAVLGNNTSTRTSTSSSPASSETSGNSGENLLQAFNNTTSKSKLEEITPPEIATGEFGNKTINGAMKNISGKTLSYVQLTFALFDSDGAQIGTAIANINNLTADSVWKYSASALTLENWTSFQLTETTAY